MKPAMDKNAAIIQGVHSHSVIVAVISINTASATKYKMLTMANLIFLIFIPSKNTSIPQQSHSAIAVYSLGISGIAFPIIALPLPNNHSKPQEARSFWIC